jgi:hypothetical protein
VTATGATSATVAFTAPANNGGSAITKYTVTSSPGGKTGTFDDQAGSGTITVNVYSLSAGTAYTFTVTATNAAGTSVPSNPSASVTTFSPPGAPTIGAATATGANSATVAFTAPDSNGGSAITQYKATSNPGGIIATVSQTGSGSIPITGLTAGTAYTFTMTATNSAGTSESSNASASFTPSGVPTINLVTAPSSVGGLAATKYTATANPGEKTFTITPTSSNDRITIPGLTAGTAYTVTVTATNSAGTSVSSNAYSFSIPASSSSGTVSGPESKK